MDPFSIHLDFSTGVLSPCPTHIQRRLSDMADMYADREAAQQAIDKGDPVLYEVYQYDVPANSGQLLVVTSIIHPGRIGDEYHMTKGHYHARRDTAEVYVGLRGHGRLLLCTEDGRFESLPFCPAAVTYIPPHWAHRMANTGGEDLVFFGVYPADAGHDYGSIESTGFPYRLLERAGEPTLLPNPSYGRARVG